jgi:hypothetical protein
MTAQRSHAALGADLRSRRRPFGTLGISVLSKLSTNTPLTAGLDAAKVEWGRLSPRGRAILQLIAVPFSLGKTVTEVARDVRTASTVLPEQPNVDLERLGERPH